MSNLDHMVSKIMEDSKKKAEEIIEKANEEARIIIESHVASGEKEKEVMLTKAKQEADLLKSSIISSEELKSRDALLTAKQEMIQKVLSLALKKLSKLSKKDYQQFLIRYLSKVDLNGGEELVLPNAYKDIDLQGIHKELKEKGIENPIQVHEGDRKVDNGFLLIKDGFENNNSFESLIDYYRDDLESLIAGKLF